MMVNLMLRKVVGCLGVFACVFALLFVGLAQAASAPITINAGGSPSALAVTPDGKYVYVPNGEYVAVIDTASNEVVAKVDAGIWPYSDATVSPNGKYAYVLDRGLHGVGSVYVINVDTNTVVSTIALERNPSGVVVSPDNKYVTIQSSELVEISELRFSSFGVVSVIDTATHLVLSNTTVGQYATHSLAISPDGNYLYVGGNKFLYVMDLSLKTETVSIKIAENTDIRELVVSPDGKYVYALSNDGIYVVSTKSKAVVATVSELGLPIDLALSPDGKYLYVTEALSNVVLAINTVSLERDFSVDAGKSIYAIEVSPDGKSLYVSNVYIKGNSYSGTVSVVNVASFAVGVTTVGEDSSIMQWLIALVLCAVVAVSAFVIVKRVRRSSTEYVQPSNTICTSNQ